MKNILFILAILALAGSGAVGKNRNGMDKQNAPRPDSIVFPLLVDEGETSETYIDYIERSEYTVGMELAYLSERIEDGYRKYVDSIVTVGADDVFLMYETTTQEIVINPDGDEVLFLGGGSHLKEMLRFVPQDDGSFEISGLAFVIEWWENIGIITHGEPIGRWKHHGNSTHPGNADRMNILELYNTYVATGKVRPKGGK